MNSAKGSLEVAETKSGDGRSSSTVYDSTQPALGCTDIVFNYGVLRALRGVSLEVGVGSSVGVVGVNGAGKSTLLGVLSGHLSASSGGHSTFGVDLHGRGLRDHMRKGVVLVPEGRHVIGKLSVYDNLLLGRSCFGFKKPEKSLLDFVFEVFPEVYGRRDLKAGALSGGEQQMLAIARALLAQPRILLLDEPSQGLAPKVQERLASSFAALLKSGVTMLIVEQNLSFARSCTSSIYALAQGEVRFHGDWESFASKADLLEEYL